MNDQKNTDASDQEAVDASDQGAVETPDQEPVDTSKQEQKVENIDVAAESDASGSDAAAEDGDEDLLAQAQEEIAKLKDSFLRAKAEQDNIRRRSEKEVANSRKFAVEGFAKEMLNVRDSLKLACAVDLADDANDAIKGIHEGVQITLKQLDSAFAKFALVEVSPEIGDKLDPNVHQAMSMVETDEVESGHILNVIQSGFSLHERLLRPAMVVVAK